MYLVTTSTRHGSDNRLFNTTQATLAYARAFVGQHSTLDGCSSEPREFTNIKTGVTTIRRSSSFGERMAVITPIAPPAD